MLTREVTYQRLGFGDGQVWFHLVSAIIFALLQYDVDGEGVAALLPRTEDFQSRCLTRSASPKMEISMALTQGHGWAGPGAWVVAVVRF